MRVLKFKAGYVDQVWMCPCIVQLDHDGNLLSIEANESTMKIDESIEGYLLPGMTNAHSHSFQYAMAGMAEHFVSGYTSDDFWAWRERMYQLANTLSPEQLLDLTIQFYMALLEEGYTSVCEFHYLHHDKNGRPYANLSEMSASLMEAAAITGIHLTLIPVYYHQSSPGVPLKPQQRRFYSSDTDAYLTLLEDVFTLAQNQYSKVLVGYGVHSLRSASPRDVKAILSSQWTPGPAHLHVSEQSEDARLFEAAYHCRAIDWLYDNVPLDNHHSLVHATHINDAEIRKITASGATVVLCPSTESNLGDGIFPFPDFHVQGGSWCIGTDSHVNLSPFIEMRTPELLHRLLLEKRNILCDPDNLDSGKIIFDRVEASGKKSAGLSAKNFPLFEKFSGVVLDSEHDRLIGRPLDSVLSILVFAGDKSLLREVYSEGKRKVLGGVHVDRIKYRSKFRKVMTDIFS